MRDYVISRFDEAIQDALDNAGVSLDALPAGVALGLWRAIESFADAVEAEA